MSLSTAPPVAAAAAAAAPLLVALAEVEGALDRVAAADPSYLSGAERREAMLRLNRSAHRLQGLLVGLVAGSDEAAREVGARSAVDWLSEAARVDRSDLARDARLGSAMTRSWPTLQAGVASGGVGIGQAHAIARALEDLPDGLDPDVVRLAEERLVGLAAHHSPSDLRLLGRRVLETVDPESADAHEQALVADDRRHAAETTSLTMRARGDGTTDVVARVPDLVAARLTTYLQGWAAPRRSHLEDRGEPTGGDRLPYRRLLGQAFCALLEHYPRERLPQHGGTATSLNVTIDLDSLLAGTGLGATREGEPVDVSEVLRLACTADLVPWVLGGQGQPLHLGRTARLFDAAQRKALALRDRRCRAEGCTVPAEFCEAHHRVPWQRGGRTDLDNGVLLCSWHHHRAHDSDFRVRYLADGDVRYARRT